jgi:hypothetical protein
MCDPGQLSGIVLQLQLQDCCLRMRVLVVVPVPAIQVECSSACLRKQNGIRKVPPVPPTLEPVGDSLGNA